VCIGNRRISLKKKLKFIVVPYLIKLIVVLVAATCRVRWHNRETYDDLRKNGQPYILCMWHNCSTFACWAVKNSGITVMVSDSRDGEYVSRLANLYGINTIRGSSSAGSSKAIRAALKILMTKRPLGITPDGPRGPKYKMQSGALWFAATHQIPIVPMHIEANRQWVINSWDNHRFPKPFSTIHIGIGTPTTVTRAEVESDLHSSTQRVEQAMMDNVAIVQKACGRENLQ
jgi:lysophospholipid acyltransferase (LPLAT)-like uncharacterized protein